MHENPCCRVGVCVHACLCKSEDYAHACVPIGSKESTLICVSEESVIEQKPFSRGSKQSLAAAAAHKQIKKQKSHFNLYFPSVFYGFFCSVFFLFHLSLALNIF